MPANINELRHELCKVFEELRVQKIEPSEAKELNNTAGKILGSIKVQLEYSSLLKTNPVIPFLDVGKK